MTRRGTMTRMAIPLLGAALLLAACKPGLDVLVGQDQRTDILRVTRPDSLVEAVVTEGSVNATTATTHRVQIVPRGGQPTDPGWDDFRADHVDSLTVTWSSPRTVDIGHLNARIFQFSNFWQSAQVRDYRYRVELRLAPRKASALPPGEWPPADASASRIPNGWRRTDGRRPAAVPLRP